MSPSPNKKRTWMAQGSISKMMTCARATSVPGRGQTFSRKLWQEDVWNGKKRSLVRLRLEEKRVVAWSDQRPLGGIDSTVPSPRGKSPARWWASVSTSVNNFTSSSASASLASVRPWTFTFGTSESAGDKVSQEGTEEPFVLGNVRALFADLSS